jgi:hypothetical protein
MDLNSSLCLALLTLELMTIRFRYYRFWHSFKRAAIRSLRSLSTPVLVYAILGFNRYRRCYYWDFCANRQWLLCPWRAVPAPNSRVAPGSKDALRTWHSIPSVFEFFWIFCLRLPLFSTGLLSLSWLLILNLYVSHYFCLLNNTIFLSSSFCRYIESIHLIFRNISWSGLEYFR